MRSDPCFPSDELLADICIRLQQQRTLGHDTFRGMVEVKIRRFASVKPAHRLRKPTTINELVSLTSLSDKLLEREARLVRRHWPDDFADFDDGVRSVDNFHVVAVVHLFLHYHAE